MGQKFRVKFNARKRGPGYRLIDWYRLGDFKLGEFEFGGERSRIYFKH